MMKKIFLIFMVAFLWSCTIKTSVFGPEMCPVDKPFHAWGDECYPCDTEKELTFSKTCRDNPSLCENLCPDREIERFEDMILSSNLPCPADKPLRQWDGLCFSCDIEKSIQVDSKCNRPGKCDGMCPNRKIIYSINGGNPPSILKRPPVGPYEGEWVFERGHSGGMTIFNCEDNKCEFSISTVNGAHTCALGGTMTIDSEIATYKYVSEYSDDSATVTFKLMNNNQTIHVDCNGDCSDFCGMRGFFMGEYENKNSPIIYKVDAFDCRTVKDKIDVLICQNELLALADNELNEIYKRSVGQLEAQHNWISNRNKCTNTECMIDIYEARIKELIPGFTYQKYMTAIGSSAPTRSFLFMNKMQKQLSKYDFSTIKSTISDTRHIDCDGFCYAYGVAGLYTISEGAFYVKDNDFGILILGSDGLRLYKNNDGKIPNEIQAWIDDLNKRRGIEVLIPEIIKLQ